jgi:uncharacterized protein YjbK
MFTLPKCEDEPTEYLDTTDYSLLVEDYAERSEEVDKLIEIKSTEDVRTFSHSSRFVKCAKGYKNEGLYERPT